jgi:hypothetical protein
MLPSASRGVLLSSATVETKHIHTPIAVAMASLHDLPPDVFRLIMARITAQLQLDSDADSLPNAADWCKLAAVCKR